MEILVDDYKIVSDNTNIILSKKAIFETGARKGETYYNPIGYYPNLYACLLRLTECKISDFDSMTLQDLLREIYTLRQELFELVDSITKKEDKQDIIYSQPPPRLFNDPLPTKTNTNNIKTPIMKRKPPKNKKHETLSTAKMTNKRKTDLSTPV